MEDITINHFAVVIAALSSFVIGALWYGPPLFLEAWKTENGFTNADLEGRSPAKLYGTSLILALIMCYNLAFFLGDADTDWLWGLTAGLLAGLGWASMAFATIALFEKRSLRYMLINCGYIVVFFTLAGFIIGIWR